MGHPLHATRESPSFSSLYFFATYLGMHRQSAGALYQKLREARGFNYGDYAYAEHFEQDGWGRFPRPNVLRREQEFSIWLRPVKDKNALFALRGALYFTRKQIDEGISSSEIARFRDFLQRYLGLEIQTDTRRLGYAIDDVETNQATPMLDRMRIAWSSLDEAKLKSDVAANISAKNIAIAIVTKDAAAFKKRLLDPRPSPPAYDAPKPKDVTDEDRIIEKLDLGLKDADVRVVSAAHLFE